jgi:hypothetical protein
MGISRKTRCGRSTCSIAGPVCPRLLTHIAQMTKQRGTCRADLRRVSSEKSDAVLERFEPLFEHPTGNLQPRRELLLPYQPPPL